MSQDVDAIILGSSVTLRDWSKEACKHNRSPTYVSVLDLSSIKSLSGLDPDGMILVFRSGESDSIETNESGYIKMRRESGSIPESFPDRRILSYYLNPAVTLEDQLSRLERKWLEEWEIEIDIQALRDYVGETFDWLYKPGAWKFVRPLAPAMLAHRLYRGAGAKHIQSVEQIIKRQEQFIRLPVEEPFGPT